MNEFSNIPIFDPEKTKSKIFATGMGIREFSRYSGIRLSSLHAWLRGTRNPKIFNIQHLASCLKCKISDISTLPRDFTKQNNHIQSTVLDRLAEEMKAAAVRNAENALEPVHRRHPGNHRTPFQALRRAGTRTGVRGNFNPSRPAARRRCRIYGPAYH